MLKQDGPFSDESESRWRFSFPIGRPASVNCTNELGRWTDSWPHGWPALSLYFIFDSVFFDQMELKDFLMRSIIRMHPSMTERSDYCGCRLRSAAHFKSFKFHLVKNIFYRRPFSIITQLSTLTAEGCIGPRAQRVWWISQKLISSHN